MFDALASLDDEILTRIQKRVDARLGVKTLFNKSDEEDDWVDVSDEEINQETAK